MLVKEEFQMEYIDQYCWNLNVEKHVEQQETGCKNDTRNEISEHTNDSKQGVKDDFLYWLHKCKMENQSLPINMHM